MITKRFFQLVLVALIVVESNVVAETPTARLVDLMPRIEDHTSMWWKDGFPGTVQGAAWDRCIRTGHYTFLLNTENMTIPHFRATPKIAYTSPRQTDDWTKLPAAKLALHITANGKRYRCTKGGQWGRHTGPRLIESGRFFQRADVTDLVFTADDGTKLNVEARFETAAWADRLALILAARPGHIPIPAGDSSFGRVGGGYGLDGTNHLEIPQFPELNSESFTLAFWAFVPDDHRATPNSPWLVCRNDHEAADGNFGIVLHHGVPEARLNIGGGNVNAFVAKPTWPHKVRIEQWNHLAMSYDGNALRLYVNGHLIGETKIDRKRIAVPGGMTFGKRYDKSNAHRFRGVVDEISFHDRALTPQEVRSCYVKPETDGRALKPVRGWGFRDDGTALRIKPVATWRDAVMEISLSTTNGAFTQRWALPKGHAWPTEASEPKWREVAMVVDPVAGKAVGHNSAVKVQAIQIPKGTAQPVHFDATVGWHRIKLDGIEPTTPPGANRTSNDAIERVKLILSNPTDREQIARLMFEKTRYGLRQRIGTPITGISAILRDRHGNPTGIPVQLSKNWHYERDGDEYADQWFHGVSQLRLPPATATELELVIAYGHWGGVAAASHAQLSLIGWGSNQLWDQSAIGAWGESICFEPEQVQRVCTITDVRPLMVRPMGRGKQWGWTNNVGGGDFFRMFDPSAKRVLHAAMRATYHRQGPCLTEVTYDGRIGTGIKHAMTVSLARSDDVLRGIYRIRMDVNKATDFSRFVIFQIGADTYSSTGEQKMAIGNDKGLVEEWATQWGGDVYRHGPVKCVGRIPWVSLHEAVTRKKEAPDTAGAWANRGVVIRSWKARLGGKDASPWMAERGLTWANSSTLDIVPPPGVKRLEPGDFIEATIEHITMPQFARDYYGPNKALRAALTKDENTWRMIHREAVGNDRRAQATVGTLEQLHPDIRVATHNDSAALTITGGLGYVPITFTGLRSSHGYRLWINNHPVDQTVHGNDFWQTNYDATTKTWSQTWNIQVPNGKTSQIHFKRE